MEQQILTTNLCQIKAVFLDNLGVRKFKIKNSQTSIEYFRDILPVDISHREAFLAIYLNRNNITVGYEIISIGGISGTIVDIRVLFQYALISNASSIIVCHNHPSGNLQPSALDKKLTNKIDKAGKLIDIKLLDHIIITEDKHYSFADNGLL